jgi:trigger factor
VSPEYFARQLTESGQVGVAITEVLRGKAATVAAEKVKVTDEAGNEINVKAQIEALNADVDAMLAAQAAEQAAAGQAGAEGDIEVSDLSIDVAGTIEADDVAEALAADEAAADDAEA